MKTVIFNIEGGIGHHFACTPAIRQLKQDGFYVIVLAAFLEPLRYNPHIDELVNIGDNGEYMRQLYTRVKNGNITIVSPSIYRNYHHMVNDPLHIKQLIAKQCGYDIDRDASLDYFPLEIELDKAKIFKEKKTENGKRRLGIVQSSGAGIGPNPVADIKILPKKLLEEVIKKTSNEICWIQVRLQHERPLQGTEYELVDAEQRKLFALLYIADIGLGVDSFAQHLMSGVCDIPFVLCCGRSRKENYANTSCRIVENPNSCKYFGCEMPFFGINRICTTLDCFNSITSDQIIKELY